MANPSNNGTVIGRIAGDLEKGTFTNKDGSTTIRFTVMSDNDYTNCDGKRDSVGVPLEAFFHKDAKGLGLFPYLAKGDQVAVTYSVRSNNYTDAEGNKHYGISLRVDSIQGLETKAQVEARRARAAAGAEGAQA